MKSTIRFFILGLLCFGLSQCNQQPPEDEPKDKEVNTFQFPTDSVTIDQWISSNQEDSLYHHTWQIWNMINQKTSIVQEGDTLRDWMTWLSPQQIRDGSKPKTKRMITLEKPRQFHGKSITEMDPSFNVSVQYNHDAADFAKANDYFSATKLKSLLSSGTGTIKDFPNASITIKPAYYVIEKDAEYARLPIWKGPPTTPGPFPTNAWNSYVYIDLTNNSSGKNVTCDSTESSGSGKCNYNLDDFIYYRLTAEEAAASGGNAQEGDYAVLLGMHLTTKETKRWTWQTYFWTATPENPPFPSSAEVAQNKAFIKDKAVAHYATTVAYQMISPVQPYTGGNLQGEPVYAFNPYLEAPFDFGPNKEIRLPGYIESSSGLIENKYGIETNCMTCHATSHYTPNGTPNNNDFYIADTYVDMKEGKVFTKIAGDQRDSILVFVGNLKTDFLWSVPDNAQ